MQDEGRRDKWTSSVVASAYIVSVAVIAQIVNSIVQEPYLDEVFHIPQARQYCRGEFMQYDPKLTTPPGLYAISIAMAHIMSALGRVLPGIDGAKACNTVPELRLTTMICALVLPWIIADYAEALSETRINKPPVLKSGSKVLLQKAGSFTSPMQALAAAESDPSGAARRARASIDMMKADVKSARRRGVAGIVLRTLDSITNTLDAHSIALLPPMWFFGFLYYTDIPSTVLVLWMFAAAKRQERSKAALLALLSLTFRQTNIVWMLFAMGCSTLDALQMHGLDTSSVLESGVLNQLRSIGRLPLKSSLIAATGEMIPYAPALAASAVFLSVNGSIVLGDRDNHKVSPHFAQPVYFAAFVIAFAWPTMLATLRVRKPSVRLLSFLTLASAGLAFLAIKNGTVVHPFLLADNRHYSFYVWRKFIGRNWWSRYALIGLYAPASALCVFLLAHRYSLFWIVGFVMCLCAAIVPSPLIEPRYFMIPYVILRQSIGPAANAGNAPAAEKKAYRYALAIEAAWAIVINAFTLHLFLNKPFRWPDSPEWQRFMW